VSHIRRFDHVDTTVADLDTVMAFFVGLGFEVEGRMFMEGEFVDTVIGIPNSRSEIVMLRPPDGGTGLSSFIHPDHETGSPDAMSNELGLRNVMFEVDNLQAIVDRLEGSMASSTALVSTRASGADVRARAGGNHRGPGTANRLTPFERLGCRRSWHCERNKREVVLYREATLVPCVRGDGIAGRDGRTASPQVWRRWRVADPY
jgi:catechol 2,3-dioxygenase-like lactoylglutathione lyase family enzyme